MNEVINIIKISLFDISSFTVWVPLFVLLPVVTKTTVYFRVLFFHLLFAAVLQAVAYYLWKNSKNNLYLLHFYTVEELVMLTVFYSYLLTGLLNKRIFIVIIALFIICAILNALYLQPLTTHNTYMRSLESLIIIIWTILYFYVRLGEDPDKQQKKDAGLLVINSGFLIYFTTSLLLFSLSNLIDAKNKEIRISLWSIHALVSIIMYILIAIGLWKHRKTAT